MVIFFTRIKKIKTEHPTDGRPLCSVMLVWHEIDDLIRIFGYFFIVQTQKEKRRNFVNRILRVFTTRR